MVDIDPELQKVKPGDMIVANKILDVVLQENMHRFAWKEAGRKLCDCRDICQNLLSKCNQYRTPIIECPEAANGIEAGDEVEVDFDSGKIYNRTKGTEFQGQPFPEFMQKLIAAGGLVNYTNSKKK